VRDVRRRSSRDDEREPEAPPPLLRPGVSNQALARLVASGTVLHAPTTWLDAQTRDGDTQRSIRDMLAVKARRDALLAGLKTSLPMPGLDTIMETNSAQVATNIFAGRESKPVGKHDTTAEEKLVAHTRRTLESHTHLADIDVDTAAEPLPETRRIMRPLDLMPEPTDLAGASADQLKVKWCGLIALVKSEGKPAIREFLKSAGAPKVPATSATDLAFYGAMHEYFYVTKGVEYDDTSNKMQLMTPFGFKLIFVGPTSFDLLYKAKLKAGTYIIDIHRPGHTMLMTVHSDLDRPLKPDEQLSDFLSFDNDGSNYNQPLNVTLKAHVVNVWQK
jgi:hypothetical protein